MSSQHESGEFYLRRTNLPAQTDDVAFDATSTLLAAQRRQRALLYDAGVIGEALMSLPEDKLHLVSAAGRLARPVVYAKDFGLGSEAIPGSTEVGIAFIVPSQPDPVYAPVAKTHSGITTSSEQYDEDQVRMVLGAVHELVELHNSGEVPYMQQDLTGIQDHSRGAWRPHEL